MKRGPLLVGSVLLGLSGLFANPATEYATQIKQLNTITQNNNKTVTLDDVIKATDYPKQGCKKNNMLDSSDVEYEPMILNSKTTPDPFKTFNFLAALYAIRYNDFNTFTSTLKYNNYDYTKTLNEVLGTNKSLQNATRTSKFFDALQLVYDNQSYFRNPFVEVPQAQVPYALTSKKTSARQDSQKRLDTIPTFNVNDAVTFLDDGSRKVMGASFQFGKEASTQVIVTLADFYKQMANSIEFDSATWKYADPVSKSVEEQSRKILEEQSKDPENKNKKSPFENLTSLLSGWHFGSKPIVFENVWYDNGKPVFSKFGWRMLSGIPDYHAGNDIFFTNWEVHSAKNVKGQVLHAGWDPKGGGNYIKILYGSDIQISYCHLLDNPSGKFKDGDILSPNTFLGYMGQSGHAQGPHTHITTLVKKNDKWVIDDPSKYIDYQTKPNMGSCPYNRGFHFNLTDFLNWF